MIPRSLVLLLVLGFLGCMKANPVYENWEVVGNSHVSSGFLGGEQCYLFLKNTKSEVRLKLWVGCEWTTLPNGSILCVRDGVEFAAAERCNGKSIQ